MPKNDLGGGVKLGIVQIKKDMTEALVFVYPMNSNTVPMSSKAISRG